MANVSSANDNEKSLISDVFHIQEEAWLYVCMNAGHHYQILTFIVAWQHIKKAMKQQR